jgi:hypothetical protein
MKTCFRSVLTVMVLAMTAIPLMAAPPANPASFALLGPSGGLGGTPFSDNQNPRFRISEVRVRSSDYIHAIQLVYEHGTGQMAGVYHGGKGGGSLDVFRLEPGEEIISVSGKYGVFIESMAIETSKGRKKSWGGKDGIASYAYQVPKGSSIQGFFGRSSETLDALGVILRTP